MPSIHGVQEKKLFDEVFPEPMGSEYDPFFGGLKPLTGVGPNTPTHTNEHGGKQSDIPYRFDLMPPLATLAVAEVQATGAKKYGDWNWKKIPILDHLNHALMHVFAYMVGDRSEKHLRNAACRILYALELWEEEERKLNESKCSL